MSGEPKIGTTAGGQWITTVVVLVLFIVMFAVLIRAFRTGKSHVLPVAAFVAGPDAGSPGPRVPPDTVTPETILADYRANEIVAKDKYSGHPYHVLGTISRVRLILGAPVLELAGVDSLGRPSDFIVVSAFLSPASKDAAEKLGPGDRVLMLCHQSDKLIEPYVGECAFDGPTPFK